MREEQCIFAPFAMKISWLNPRWLLTLPMFTDSNVIFVMLHLTKIKTELDICKQPMKELKLKKTTNVIFVRQLLPSNSISLTILLQLIMKEISNAVFVSSCLQGRVLWLCILKNFMERYKSIALLSKLKKKEEKMYQFRQPKVKIVALAGSWESARLGEEPANKEVGESEGNLPYLAMRGTCKYWCEPARQIHFGVRQNLQASRMIKTITLGYLSGILLFHCSWWKEVLIHLLTCN